jgi:hypothetical protein
MAGFLTLVNLTPMFFILMLLVKTKWMMAFLQGSLNEKNDSDLIIRLDRLLRIISLAHLLA